MSTRIGIPGALTAVSTVQRLFKLLTSRVVLVRSGASIALGYLSFDPEARRQLLNWCVSRHYCRLFAPLSAEFFASFHNRIKKSFTSNFSNTHALILDQNVKVQDHRVAKMT